MCLAAPEQDSKALRQQQLKSFSAGFSSFMDCSGLNRVLSAGSLPKHTPHPVSAVPPTVLEIVHCTSGHPFPANACYGTLHYLRKSDTKRQL